MPKKISSYFMLLASILILAASLAVPRILALDPKQAACEGLGIASGSTDCTPPAGSPNLNTTLGNVINVLSIIIGIISVIMIIVSGLRFITSGGDPNSVNGAKNGLLYAIIGVVIVVFAQMIVHFVINRTQADPVNIQPPGTSLPVHYS